MKCKKFECSQEASGGFPCCSIDHGVAFKRDKEDYLSYTRPFKHWNFKDYGLKDWSIIKIEYYAKLCWYGKFHQEWWEKPWAKGLTA